MKHRKRCAVQVGAGAKCSTESEISDIPKREGFEIGEVESALKKALLTHRIDLKQALHDSRNDMFNLLHSAVKGMKKKVKQVRDEKSYQCIKFVILRSSSFIKRQIYMIFRIHQYLSILNRWNYTKELMSVECYTLLQQN